MVGRRELRRRAGTDRSRERILRKATYYTVFFALAGVLVAVAGAALIALLLRFGGLPFLITWLVVSAVAIVAGIVLVVVMNRKERNNLNGRT